MFFDVVTMRIQCDVNEVQNKAYLTWSKYHGSKLWPAAATVDIFTTTTDDIQTEKPSNTWCFVTELGQILRLS